MHGHTRLRQLVGHDSSPNPRQLLDSGAFSVISLNSGVSGCGRALAWQMALELLKRHAGRGAEGLPSWNAAASGLVGGRTWRLAQGLLGEMMGDGPQPDLISFGSVMRGPLSAWPEASALLDEARWRQLQPGMHLFNAAIICLGEGAAWEQVLHLFTGLDAPDAATRHAAISAAANSAATRAAVALVAPAVDVVGVTAALGALDGQQWQKAFEQMCSMRVRRNDIDDISCVALLGACEKVALWRHALQVLPPGANIAQLNTAFASCEKGRRWEEALGLLRSMRRPNPKRCHLNNRWEMGEVTCCDRVPFKKILAYPEAGMESPRAQGEVMPPAWKEVYGGGRFEVRSLFPPFTWLPAYIRFAKGHATAGDSEKMGELPYSIKGDFIAGLTVGLMLVPQCLAFALLAGLPIRAGLYSSFAPLVIYALLGTLRQLQVGPTALISLLTGQALDAVNLLGDDERLSGASTLALLVGLVSLLLGILRFGFVVDFMSHSVMSSFCTASGVIIATSQLKHVLGINIKRHKYWWETAYDLCSKLPETDAATAVLGFTLLAMLTFFKKWKQAGNEAKRSKSLIWRWFPKSKDSCAFKSMKICADLSSVLCVILGWVWGFIYREAGINSVRLINDSESNGFVFLLPSFDGKTPDLIVPAVMIAVVGFLETIAVGGKMANEKRYSYDANQELLALGAANVGGAFMGAFPITGGFSRTAVNAMFGASSPLAGALTSIIVVIAVYSLMPVVEMLPLAALAPLIIHGAIGVTDFKAFIPTFKGNKLDFLIMLFTFLMSLGLTVKEGLITGVALSILKLTYEVAMPNLAVCGQVEDGTFRDVRYYPEGQMIPKSVVVRMDAGISFANTRRLQEFCMRAMSAASKADSSVSHLILDCKSVNGTDMTGCEAIENLAISLEKRKKSLVLANLKAPLTKAMFAAGVDKHIEAHGGHLCWNMAQAIALALLAALAVPPLDAAHAQLAAQLEFFLALEGLSSLHSWRCSGVRTTGTERERSGQGPFDGMDLHGGWSASPSNGCTESGWKGDYSIFGGHQKILSVEIGPEKTTFTWSPEVASQAKQLNEQTKLGTWMRMEGPQLNQDLADFFCSPGWHASARLVTNACSFWSSLTSRCPALSAEPIDPESLPESAVTAVGLVDSAAEARLPDPFREVHLGGPWIPAPTNGCED
eukprot:g17175.t1